MKINEIIFIILIFILTPIIVSANGLISKNHQTTDDIMVKNFVYHNNQTQTLITSFQFKSQKDNFAIIIPTPEKPAIKEIRKNFFTDLYETAGNIESETASNSMIKLKSDKFTIIEESDFKKKIKKIENLGYPLLEKQKDIIRNYQDKNWFLTIVEFENPESSGENQNQFITIPIRLDFKTTKPILPKHILKINAVYQEKLSKEAEFIDGVKEKAVQINPNQLIALSEEINGVNFEKGSVEFFIKAKGGDEFDNILEMEKRNDIMEITEELKISYNKENIKATFSLPFTNTEGEFNQNEFTYTARRQENSDSNNWTKYTINWDFTQKNNLSQPVRILENDNSLLISSLKPIQESYSPSRFIKSKKASLSLGGTPVLTNFDGANTIKNYTVKHNSPLLIDELIISNKFKSPILEASFETNLNTINFKQSKPFLVYNRKGSLLSEIKDKPIKLQLYLAGDKHFNLNDFNIDFEGFINPKDIDLDLEASALNQNINLLKLSKTINAKDISGDLTFEPQDSIKRENKVFNNNNDNSFYFALLSIIITILIAVLVSFIMLNLNKTKEIKEKILKKKKTADKKRNSDKENKSEVENENKDEDKKNKINDKNKENKKDDKNESEINNKESNNDKQNEKEEGEEAETEDIKTEKTKSKK